jgi:hypothetical protein
MENAAHYRRMPPGCGKFAESAANPGIRNQLLELAPEYEKLAERAEARARKPKPPNER